MITLSKKFIILSIIFWLILDILDLFVVENIKYLEVNKDPLPNIIHRNIPIWPRTELLPSILVFIVFLYSLIRFTYINTNIIGLLFVTLGLLRPLRILIYTVTQTPSAMPIKYNHCKKHLLNYIGISFSKEKNSCIDNMFSGHATSLMVPVFLLLIFSKNSYEKIMIGIIAIITNFLVINSRMHYTSDVLVSIFMSYGLVYIIKDIFKENNIKLS